MRIIKGRTVERRIEARERARVDPPGARAQARPGKLARRRRQVDVVFEREVAKAKRVPKARCERERLESLVVEQGVGRRDERRRDGGGHGVLGSGGDSIGESGNCR